MIVMPTNNAGIQVGYMAGKYPNRIGWLLSPDGWIKPPTWMPYAIDNGAYGAWSNNIPWNEDKFLNHLEKTKTAPKKPLWVVVPMLLQIVKQPLKSGNNGQKLLGTRYTMFRSLLQYRTG